VRCGAYKHTPGRTTWRLPSQRNRRLTLRNFGPNSTVAPSISGLTGTRGARTAWYFVPGRLFRERGMVSPLRSATKLVSHLLIRHRHIRIVASYLRHNDFMNERFCDFVRHIVVGARRANRTTLRKYFIDVLEPPLMSTIIHTFVRKSQDFYDKDSNPPLPFVA